MAAITQLTSVEQWKSALQDTSSKPLLVFKHSTQCPVSGGAHEELTKFLRLPNSLPSISRSYT